MRKHGEHERTLGCAHQTPDPEFAIYLRTYQGSETAQHRAWRRNVITLWHTLHNMAPYGANTALRTTLEYLGNRGPRRDINAKQVS
jgi:hypothetical protein